MAITVSAYNFASTTLESSFSASKPSIAWLPVIYISGGITLQTVPVNNDVIVGTYVNDSSPVVWGFPAAVGPTLSNNISVTALNDNMMIYLSAMSSTNSDTALSAIRPYYLNVSVLSSDINSAMLSCFYTQASSGAIRTIPTGEKIEWALMPTVGGIMGNLMAGAAISAINGTSISGYSPSASRITYVYDMSDFNQDVYAAPSIVDDKYRLSPLSADFQFTQSTKEITFNPSVNVYVENESSATTILCAIRNDVRVPASLPLTWNVSPTTNVIALTGIGLGGSYIFNTPGVGASLSSVKLSSANLFDLYAYSLSSYTGIASGYFRPFGYAYPSMGISANITQQANEENVFVYYVAGIGLSGDVPFNIDDNESIKVQWETTSSGEFIQATRIDDTTSYNFGTPGVASNIDRIYIHITAPLVTTAPKACTASFQVCALSANGSNDIALTSYNFDLNYREWISEDAFNPMFRFQCEPESQNIIYRPSTLAYYSISNTSILPSNSFGYITYTFNDSTSSLPYDNRVGGIGIPTDIIHYFSSDFDVICSISMTVCASGAGFESYVIRESDTKQIVFAEIPQASEFLVYPEFRWNGSSWEYVVFSQPTNAGNILIPTALLSAYSVCHTENFFLSSGIDGLDEYKWNIKNIDGSAVQASTVLNVATAWLPVKTGKDSSTLEVSVSVFGGLLSSSNMTYKYYDTPQGTVFDNIASTLDSTITSDHKQNIKLVGVNELGIQARLSGINYTQQPAPGDLYLSGAYTSVIVGSLFDVNPKAFYFNVSSNFWNEKESARSINNYIATTQLSINVDDIGNSYLGVPLNEKTKIKITPEVIYDLGLKAVHPRNSDWCLSNITDVGSAYSAEIAVYPMNPVIYNSNRFVVTGVNVVFENLVQCFNGTSGFNWGDRGNSVFKSTCVPYATSFDSASEYDISLTNSYSGITLQNDFSNIVTVQSQYLPFDSDIIRIFEFTKLSLPCDLEECSMPPNEWTVKDTFNATIKKLNDNLEYLQNMSQLYDVPPTDYMGWFGSLYYNNSTVRTRWFTNTPHNSYSYDHPENSINGMFDNLQSCYIHDNIMYISNGTSVSILSSGLWGSQLGYRSYKTLGDDFVNVRSIELDSENRIYVLDSYDSNNLGAGSKNRVLVFSFDFITLQWQLMYEWGGLGGPGAKNKFNGASDLHVDNNDMIWIADTNNKCVKKYTRTGSWLNTITSEYFNDTEKPLSITTDSDDNLFVLTKSQIVKFGSAGEFVEVFDIGSGATRIENCRDGGFIYIVYSDKIVKFTTYGVTAGVIAQNDFASYDKDYRNVFHDEYRNLYIANKNHILKYTDQLSILSLKLDTTGLAWPLEKLLVQKDEFIQDWVINRCFQRFWDNLEIFRQSLIGKFSYQIFQNTSESTTISVQPEPDGFDHCNYDWLYGYGRPVTQDITFEYYKPAVRSFVPSEYKILPHSKEKIYVGINELNSADVYNRVIGKLFECEETLLEMIND